MKALDGIGLAVVAALTTTGALSIGPAGDAEPFPLEYTPSPETLTYSFAKNEDDLAVYEEVLLDFFGPHAAPSLPEDADLEALGIEEGQLDLGREQFRVNCLHCHGSSGGAGGTTAAFLNPKPRNFRKGIIKFCSTPSGSPPTRGDIQRILHNGVAYTAMPAFGNNDKIDMEAMTSYVQFLLMRGGAEEFFAVTVDEEGLFEEEWDDPEELKGELTDLLTDAYFVVEERWTEAADSVVNPPIPRTEATPESIERGKQVFMSAETECSACHGDDGSGRGPNVWDKEVGFKLVDKWGNKAQPADLRKGIYRGGHRPIDIYRRIARGIEGTPMPQFDKLTPEQIWDVVNYVYSIPYEQN